MLALITLSTLAWGQGLDDAHSGLATFLEGAVSDQGVDYRLLASRRAVLDAYLAQVATVDASSFNKDQQLALYVNAYNAYTLATMLEAGPPASIRDLDGGDVWGTRTFAVAGQQLTLNQMEHEHARKLADGRVHSVVNCASKGCPPLPPTPMVPTDVSGQLEAGAKRWAASNAFTLTERGVQLSKIFDWYAGDFTASDSGDIPGVEGKEENALWFLSHYVDEATKARLVSGELTVGWQDYDWSINAR